MYLRSKSAKNRIVLTLVPILLAISLVITGCPAPAAEVLNMGLVPAEDPEKIIASFQPMIEVLEKILGMEIKPFVATDYAGVVEAMRVGKIDIAWFGPFSYVLAAERAGAVAIAKGMDLRGETTYRSLIVTHKESGIKTLDDLRGKDFAFVDPASTSGHLIPRFMLMKAGLDPEKDFKSFTFAGGHDAVGLAVKHQKVGAGGVGEPPFKAMVRKGIIVEGEVVVLAVSDPIPNSPIAVRGDLDPELKKKIQQAILEVHKHMTAGDMGWHGVIKYVEARDEDYDIIREVQKLLGL
ncbi:MAG: Phosphate-import protein PhnD [Syntrophomonadaceae bacterium]|nr:Phosphate-import protein PhnD [Bacillota bacterium]